MTQSRLAAWGSVVHDTFRLNLLIAVHTGTYKMAFVARSLRGPTQLQTRKLPG